MSDRDVYYRAVHVKTRWRKVKGHTSIDNALYGPRDGAPGLFANKVRINYVQHGAPLFVLVWRDGEEYGYVAKPDASESTGVTVRDTANVRGLQHGTVLNHDFYLANRAAQGFRDILFLQRFNWCGHSVV